MQAVTNDFNIRDPNNGVIRIGIGTKAQTGSAGIEIFDRHGRKRIGLGTEHNTDIPGILFMDANGITTNVIQ